MPDLGQYAGTVLGAYTVTVVLIGGLLATSIWRNAQVRRALEKAELKTKVADHGEA
ncbi:MAG: heme exporter protein CcmD [Pseudomonadota bacterium]